MSWEVFSFFGSSLKNWYSFFKYLVEFIRSSGDSFFFVVLKLIMYSLVLHSPSL